MRVSDKQLEEMIGYEIWDKKVEWSPYMALLDLRDSRAEAAAAESLRAAMQEERNAAMRDKETAEEKLNILREKARAVVEVESKCRYHGGPAFLLTRAIDALREAVEGR